MCRRFLAFALVSSFWVSAPLLAAQSAAIWRIQNPEGQSRILQVTHQGETPSDVWLMKRDDQGHFLSAERVLHDLAPGQTASFSLPPVALSGGEYWQFSANQALSLKDVDAGEFGLESRPALKMEPAGSATSLRDDRGVWFIKGGSLADVMEMMGYNVATDRLWQAEVFRRTARGRLAEIFGPSLLSQDQVARTTGYSDEELDQAFASLDAESQLVVTAYAEGFNRRIAEVIATPQWLPFEFGALGMTQIAPWDHRDILAWTDTLQREFSVSRLGIKQVDNGVLLQELVGRFGGFTGVAMFLDARWLNDPKAPTMIPTANQSKKHRKLPSKDLLAKVVARAEMADLPDLKGALTELGARLEENERQRKRIGAFVKMGSYAWVVSGSKTQSGNPILYSGPQMGFSAPVICLEGSIESESLTVSGMTVPGIPGMIIGRTPHHAWSMQVGHTPTWDFYIENQDDIFVHRVETIKVAGGDDVEVQVMRSSRGSIVNQSPLLSWKYAHRGKAWNFSGGNIALARATNMDEFGAGIANLGVTQHFTYADRDGNIAYWMSGRNPIRQAGEYRLPQGFLGPALEWDADQVHPPVHDRNTAQGFYGGWNNKARADMDDPTGTYAYGAFHRAQVVQDYLRNNNNLTFEQVRDLALNIATTDSFGNGGNPWPLVAGAFKAAVAALPNAERTQAVAMLESWDGHFVAGGAQQWTSGPDLAEAWVLMDHWIRTVLTLTFDDELGNKLNSFERFGILVRELDGDPETANFYRGWFRNRTQPDAPQDMQSIILAALDQTLGELGPRPWGAGERGEIEYSNEILGVVTTTPYSSRSTYAHCVAYDNTGPVRIESMFPLGQSGFASADQSGAPSFDPHAFSMKPLFDAFVHRLFPSFEGLE